MSQEQIQTSKVINMGGLTSNVNHLQLSDVKPGSAVQLLNFETSLSGGYRRLSGFQPLITGSTEVDAAGAEGRILGVAIFKDEIYAIRKQKSGATYDFYKSTGSAWVKVVTGFTRVSTGVTKVRHVVFNFDGTDNIVFVDGVNEAILFNGTTWSEINIADTGADYAHAGGNQAIDKPKYAAVYKNHLFLAGDSSYPGVIAHSAPNKAYDFLVANGAGQLVAGLSVNQIKPYLDALIVFSVEGIKKIEVSSSTFVINGITSNIGCLASDSVVEIGGNLVFLSQDGFRPIASSEKIGDTNIETLSTDIQELVTTSITGNDMSELVSVVLRNKSQMRVFFSSPSLTADSTYGIIGCMTKDQNGSAWEWGQLKGISCNTVVSRYIGATEYVIHGDYLGNVFIQEQGTSFNGSPIVAVFRTPYLDFGGAGIRKTLRKIKLFLKSEGSVTINLRLTYDWADSTKLNPDQYDMSDNAMTNGFYGSITYGTGVYGEDPTPVFSETIEGSGHSVQMTYSTVDTNASYTLHGALYQYSVEGIK